MSSKPSSAGSQREQQAAQLRVVRRKTRRLIVRGESRRIAPLAIAGTIAALAIVFAVLLEQVILAQSAFKLAELRKDLIAAETRHHELLVDAAKYESSERIERIARNHLGMVAPHPSKVDYIAADVVRPPSAGLALRRRADTAAGRAAAEAGEDGLVP